MLVNCENQFQKSLRVVVRALAYDNLNGFDHHFKQAKALMINSFGSPDFSHKTLKNAAIILAHAYKESNCNAKDKAYEALSFLLTDNGLENLKNNSNNFFELIAQSPVPNSKLKL